MLRIILGIIAGFVAWSIIWVGSDQVLMMIWPGWYGAHQTEFQWAMFNQGAFTPDSTILLMHIFRSVVISIMAGYLAAVAANENRKAPLWLGILLLLFGLMVQMVAWSYLPVWYHFVFLVLLVPTTVLGGRMKDTSNLS